MGYYGNNPYGLNPYNFSQNQMPQNNYQQQVSNQMPQPAIPQSNIIKVTGIEGAKAYQMHPNSSVILLDDSNDILYFKTTDGANFPTLRVFPFSELKEEQTQSDYVTRQEFNELKEMLSNGKQYIPEQPKSKQSKQSKSKQPSTDDAKV